MTSQTLTHRNRFFRLPLQFDPARLEVDLAICQTIEWPQHYNQNDFAGRWSSLALRSLSGNETDVRALPGEFADTLILKQCAYFQEIMGQFECPKEAVRLMALAPGSVINEHRDGDTSYGYGFFRLHIPIQTGEQVAFRVDGELLPMAVGECWYANFDLLHSVRNDGPTDRIHLVLDCRRNAWSDRLFKQAGYDFSLEQQGEQLSPEVRAQILAELARHNTDKARQLMEQLAAQ